MESLEGSPGLVCPITQSLMHEPVIGTDGYTYERQAIEAWLLKHGCSPMTREPMAVSHLRPNRAIADQIMWLLEANPKAAASFAAEQPCPFPSPSSADVPPSSTNSTTNTLKVQLKADLLQGSSSASPSAPVAPSSAQYFGGAAGAAPSTPHVWPPQPPGAEGRTPGPSAPPLPPHLAAPQPPPAPRHPSSAEQQLPIRETPQQHRQYSGNSSGSGNHHHHQHYQGKNKSHSKKHQQQKRVDNHNDPENLSVDFKTYGGVVKVKNDFNERRDLAEGGNYRGGVVVKPSKKNSSCVIM